MGHDAPIPADGSRSGESSDVPDTGEGFPDDVDRLADLDDRLGGHTPADDDAAEGEPPNGEVPPEGLDAILLLRQLAAEDRGAESDENRESPRRIGRFAIVREVGRGGFARVYEAFDTRLLRRVALKVARPETVLPQGARRRFVREAELAARLVHPHVVTIHEAGEADGHLFIAEEFCPGGNLGEWLELHPGTLPPRVAARIVHTLAGAVAHSHGFCILHRDIKPANVLLVPAEAGPLEADGVAGRLDVKLADFGLGKITDPESGPGGASELTRAGTRIGTLVWMAPEQVDAALGPVGPATDVHALGLFLDRLLTGRCAHAGSDDAETMRLVLTAEPVPPDRVAPGVPADLAAVTAKCLAKHPADRYATVADLAVDLGRFLDGRPTLVRPVSPFERGRRLLHRHRALAAASTLAIAASLMALFAVGLERHKQRLLAERAAEVRGLQAAATLRRGFESWRVGDVQQAIVQLEDCSKLDPRLAESLAGGWLRARLHGEEAILLRPDGAEGGKPIDLHAVAVSPDGTLVAAGGADGRLAVVDMSRGESPRFRVPLHDEINDVAFSPDGTLVATVGQDGRVCVSDAADGTLVRVWQPADGALFGVAWGPDGVSIACGGASQAIHRLALSGGESVAVIRPFDGLAPPVKEDAAIESLAFVSSDRLAMACGDRVLIAEARAGKIVHELPGHRGTVSHVAASGDGRLVVSGGTDRQPRVWDAETGELVADLGLQPSWVAGCRFTPDGGAVVTGCRDGVVRVLPVAGGSVAALAGHVGRVWEVAVLPDGGVVSVGADGTLRHFDVRRPAEFAGVREIPFAVGPVSTIAVADGLGSADDLIVGTGQQLLRLDRAARVTGSLPVVARYTLVVDDARRKVAAVDEDYRIVVTPIPGAGEGITRVPETWRGQAVVWCGEAGLLVGGADGRIALWDDRTGRTLTIDDLGRGIDAVAVTLGHERPQAVVVAGKSIRLYDLPRTGSPRVGVGRPLLDLPPTTGTVRVVAFAPDGMSFVIGTNEGGVDRYDAKTGLPLGTFARHASDIRALEWSPDGRTLVSVDSACVRFSDVRTTTVFDDFRPGWTIASARLSCRKDASPVLVVAGDVSSAGDGTGTGRIAVATFAGE